MVLNLSNWFEQAEAKEKNGKKISKNGSGSAINTIFSNISGKSRSSVKRLRNQGKKGHEMGSPSKSNGRKQIILDNFEAQLLRRIVPSFYYCAKKEAPTLDKIKAQLPLADGFPKMSRETLRKYKAWLRIKKNQQEIESVWTDGYCGCTAQIFVGCSKI